MKSITSQPNARDIARLYGENSQLMAERGGTADHQQFTDVRVYDRCME